MEYEWDEEKRKQNIQKHGIDFEDVKEAFSQPLLSRVDTREDYGEERLIGIGIIREVVIVIAYTEPNENTIRIISARKAKKNESKNYHIEIKDRLDQSKQNEG
jgi:uncharacterized DUF497 family protein